MATAAAGKPPRYPELDATAPGGGEKNPPARAQGAATRPTRAALAPGDTLHSCRRGLRPAQLRSSPKGPSPMGTTHRCGGWTEDLHSQRGLAPEVT